MSILTNAEIDRLIGSLETIIEIDAENAAAGYGPQSEVDQSNALIEKLNAMRPKGAIGRLERFVASGDTEVLLEGLPEGQSTPCDQTPVVTPGVCPHCGATKDGGFFDNVEDEYAWCYTCRTHSLNPRWEKKPQTTERFSVPVCTPNGYDPHGSRRSTTFSPTVRSRGSELTDLNDSLWERFIGPMADAIERGEYPDLCEVEDESRGHH